MKILLDPEDRVLIRYVVNTNPKANILLNKVGEFLGIHIEIMKNNETTPPPLIIEINRETLIKMIIRANKLANPSNFITGMSKSLFKDMFKIQEQSKGDK